MYPIVYFDALRLKIRDEGTVKNKAVYLALGVRADGYKEVLGLWIEQTEGAKFWLKVFNDLKNRGLHDILIAVVDGLRGFPDAIEAVYPQAQIQTCIVHLIRNPTTLAAWKDRKELAAALKPIYQAANADLAAAALDAFAAGPWGIRFPTVAAMWQRQWQQVIPFFAYPPEVRKIIYTTNSIESPHMRLRKMAKNRGHFPSDEAATKLLFLALRNIEKDWKMPPQTWKQAANHSLSCLASASPTPSTKTASHTKKLTRPRQRTRWRSEDRDQIWRCVRNSWLRYAPLGIPHA
jgi:putative transposase